MTTVYAAMRDGFRVVDPDEGTALRATALDGRALECVAAHPDRPDRVFVGTFESGLWRAVDGGESFERVGADAVEQDAVMAAAVSPHDPDRVWVGTEPSRVYRSDDGGDTWTRRDGLTDLPSSDGWAFPPRPHTHHVRWIEPDPHHPGRLSVAVEAGALVTTDDGGDTWHDRVAGSRRDTHSMATHPDAPGRVWCAAGDGYAETADGGETWTHPQSGLDRTYCWSVAVDAGDPETVLLSVARSAREAHSADRAETYVYRRVGDAEWERLDGRGLPMGGGVTRPVLAAGDAGECYALSNRGLYRTADAGDSWAEVALDRGERGREQTARGLVVVP
ncbi:WD40/YVTN/BNR-like repeat-containing protein [Halobaculum lipolyticum]|uniref:WD40/YVTN/BNR-like repeat-containing protein n=1 Tax=Halobaculum lipolyticum TaxID=3032001 RepID=A0ABD5WEL0_9EURY